MANASGTATLANGVTVTKPALSRLADSLLTGGYNSENKPMLNIEHGGQFGWSPVIGRIVDGEHFSEFISAHRYIPRNVVAILLQYPGFFDLLRNPEKWHKALKSLVELHSKKIEGLNAGITLEFDEKAIGGAGEMYEQAINATRERTQVKMTFDEKAGKPINRFLNTWIRYGIMDPDTKTALVGTLDTYKTDLYTPDYYTMTCLFYEPDETTRWVQEAWLVTNMMPKSDGEVTGAKDHNDAQGSIEMEIEFTGIAMSNNAVHTLADNILSNTSTVKVDPKYYPLNVSHVGVKAKHTNLHETGTDQNAPVGFTRPNYINGSPLDKDLSAANIGETNILSSAASAEGSTNLETANITNIVPLNDATPTATSTAENNSNTNSAGN